MRNLLPIVLIIAVAICLVTIAAPVFADQKDLAKASQNPIGNMISLPLQNNTYFNVGPDKKSANSFQLQPVYPINFGNFNLINRMIIPISHLESQKITVPVQGHLKDDHVTFKSDSVTWLGNITWQGFI